MSREPTTAEMAADDDIEELKQRLALRSFTDADLGRAIAEALIGAMVDAEYRGQSRPLVTADRTTQDDELDRVLIDDSFDLVKAGKLLRELLSSA